MVPTSKSHRLFIMLIPLFLTVVALDSEAKISTKPLAAMEQFYIQTKLLLIIRQKS